MTTDFRASAPLLTTAAKLGPLADLAGTWVGDGFNLIFLPQQGKEPFRVKLSKTRETLTFAPIGAPIPDRGSAQDIEFLGLHYFQMVSDAGNNESLHLEAGMWLNVPATSAPASGPSIVRLATIPHGDSLLAVGHASSVYVGPTIAPVSPRTTKHDGGKLPNGYLDPFEMAALPAGVPEGSKENPNLVLTEVIGGQTITNTVVLQVSTIPNGGIVNMPFVVKNANANRFNATFWIETVTADDGSCFMQLQYSQTVNLDFLDIDWPSFKDRSQ